MYYCPSRWAGCEARRVRYPLTRALLRGLSHMPSLTYAGYLDLEKLLTLQKPRSTPAEHDEMVRCAGADATTGAFPTR